MRVDGAERRQVILDVTADLLLRHGYNRLTMNDVAGAVGLDRRLIYFLFSSKDTLVEAVVLREMSIYVDAWSRYLDNDPLGGSVATVYRSLLAVLKQLPLMTAIYVQDEHIFGKYLRKPGGFFAYWPPDTGSTRDFLQEMQEAGVVRQDVDASAAAFILDALAPSILQALYPRTKVSGGDSRRVSRPAFDDFDDLVKSVAELCERWLTPPAGADLEAGKVIMRRRVEKVQELFAASLGRESL